MVATAALLGSALLTLAVGFLGARYDHRRLLLAAASLMVATGVAFAAVDDYAILLVVAFAGTANPSAGSVSVFVPLEHAVLAREAVSDQRTKIFARYSLIGALAGAAGSLAAAAPELMAPLGLGEFDRAQDHVRPVCRSRSDRWPVLRPHPKAAADFGSACACRARAISPYRL